MLPCIYHKVVPGERFSYCTHPDNALDGYSCIEDAGVKTCNYRKVAEIPFRITRHGQLLKKDDGRGYMPVATVFYWPGIVEDETIAASDIWRQ